MKKPAFEKACDVVAGLIERQRSDRVWVLPNVHDIAAIAGTSHITVLKALDTFREKGLILTGKGRRSRIINPSQPAAKSVPVVARNLKWEHLYRQINSHLINGVYPPAAALPSPKELMKTYGACYRTMRKVLARLQSEGRIVARPRGYAAASPVTRKQHDTVILSGPMDASGDIALYTPRSPEFLRVIEQECSRTNVRLEIWPYDQDRDLLRSPGREAQASLDKSTPVIGFIVWTTGFTPETLRPFIHRLAGFNRPVSLLEEAAVFDLPRLPSRRLLRIFPMGISPLAGRLTGRYLLELGHRRIAYVSPTHENLWSRSRLDGLRSAFADAGYPDGVAAFTDERFHFPMEYPAQRSAVDSVIRMLTDERTEGTAGPVLLSRSGIIDLRSRINEITWGNTMRGILIPLLERACADPSITAWVGAEDSTSISSLEYLRIIGRRVPQDVTITGFDDTIEASLNRLTSYNFNTPAVVRAMLDFVFNPRSPRGGDVVEIEGTVVGRRSSGPPNGRGEAA